MPFNHLLPAWDAITGMMATTSLLAAERRRARTGEGQFVRLALSDVAFWMVGNLGKIAEVQINRHERLKDGNYLYGAFGRDFATKDGYRVMIVALTLRQWQALVQTTGLGEGFDTIAKLMNVDLSEEGGPLRGTRGNRGHAQAMGVAADARGSARPSMAPASPRGLTRHSPNWSRTIRAPRPRIRCSRRSSSRGSAPTACRARN